MSLPPLTILEGDRAAWHIRLARRTPLRDPLAGGIERIVETWRVWHGDHVHSGELTKDRALQYVEELTLRA